MAKTTLCRKVYKFRMEPTELEALELERTASVARSIYNWGLERCQQYLPAERQEQALGGTIRRTDPAQTDGVVAV